MPSSEGFPGHTALVWAVCQKSSTRLLGRRLHIHYEFPVQYSVHERLSGPVRVRKPEARNFVVGVVSVDLRGVTGVDGQGRNGRNGKTHQIDDLTSTVWVSLQKE